MESVDMRDFNYLSASWEIENVELRKFGEPSKSGNPEPSFRNEEGVETRHGAPKS